MQELEKTGKRVASVWWLIVWRAGLGGVILGAVVGAIIGFVEGAMGLSEQVITASSSIAGALVSMAWGFVVVRMALTKKYHDFRLAMLPPN